MPCAPGLSSNHEPVSAGCGSPEMIFSSSAASHAGSRPVRAATTGWAKAVRSARRRRLPTLCFDALMPARFPGFSELPKRLKKAAGEDLLAWVSPRSVDAATKDGVAAIAVGVDALTQANRDMIADLALRHRMPTIYGSREYVDAGGLISYGPSYTALISR